MTCDQIKAEFAANGGLDVNKEDTARAQAASQNFQAANAQVQAEGKAMAAREQAEDIAAAPLGMTPVGGAFTAAVQARQVAEQQAFAARAKAKLDPATQQMMGSTGAVVGDVATQMQANPRQARLIALAEQRNCH